MSFSGFLLDENVDPSLRAGLNLRWPEAEIWMVGDPGAPPRGTRDPELLAWCELAGFVLITNNRASMPGHLAEHLASGRHVPGHHSLEFKLE